ncbi:MAG: hypothetical protein CVU05_07160 [Bacteroidetes bacterium HGW-Bacteroidetes-21]|nr:MAG: hypothetical protein CVU05_07160 [Bacteroidetes bacterium HGW-Bacteroidetes-21]
MRILFVFILCMLVSNVFSQKTLKEVETQLYNEALDLIDEEKYEFAERNYLKLINIDSTNFTYLYDLGMLYFKQLYQKPKSVTYLKKAIQHLGTTSDLNVYLYLAQAYQNIEKYDEAIKTYEDYDKIPLKEGQIKVSVSEYIEKCKYAKKEEENQKRNMRFRVVNLGNTVNTHYSEYAAIPMYKDTIILFTSRRTSKTDSIEMIYDQFWEYMYLTKKTDGSLHESKGTFKTPVPFETYSQFMKFGKKTTWHKAVVGIYPDNSKLIIFQKQKLWTSQFKDGVWQKPKKLPKAINFGDYQRHASVTADGKTMYFSAFPQGETENIDIYTSKLQENGKWSPAVNLGIKINTDNNEDSPEITPDGKTLYFSSNGHQGMGEYDIFKSELVDGEWSAPINMGFPVNSPADDIFYKRNGSDGVAYMSSSRAQGFGKMDVYMVIPVNPDPDFTNCARLDKEKIDWINIDFSFRDSISVGEPATFDALLFKVRGSTDRHYFWNFGDMSDIGEKMSVEHKYAAPGEYKVTLQVKAWNDSLAEEADFCIDKKITVLSEKQVAMNNSNNNENTTKASLTDVDLQPVFFGYDKNNISISAQQVMENNLKVLKENPQLKIRLEAHTDARGSSEYNMSLSQRRADSVKNFLLKNGIDKSRIIETVGLGETILFNKCADGVECNDEEHQINRRTNFIIAK